jgi:hypothetical protein
MDWRNSGALRPSIAIIPLHEGDEIVNQPDRRT